MTFSEKLDKVLRGDKTILNESEEAYGTHSPTQVKPEKGLDVNKGVIDGTGEIDATGPVKAGVAARTLKTTPGVSPTEGPTGHIPTNSDLPRGQNDGLGTENGPGKKSLPSKPKVYGLSEEDEEEDKAKKLKEEEEESKKKLPPFMLKKKKMNEEEDEDAKAKKLKEEKEEDESKKKLKEEEDSKKKEKDLESDAANKRAGFTQKSKNSGEKGERLKEASADHVEGISDHGDAKEKLSVKEEEEESKKKLKEEEDDEKMDKKAVKEASQELFVGQSISEALMEKTATIFEATLSTRIKDYRKVLTDRFTKKLNSRVEIIREELSEAVSDHLDLVVEHWVKQNEVPLEKAIKSELVEDFISGLKALFEEHYIELPEEKVDVVAEMVNRVSKLEQKLNEQIDTNVKLQKEVKLYERNDIFNKVAKSLAETQVEKLRILSEGVEFRSEKQFETALTTLKGNLNSTPPKVEKKPKTLVEQTLEQQDDIVTSDMMSKVTDTLARMSKK